ncbi:protein mono-ADP-ribosyltransferase PARP11-like [Dreissena polymorpha]|uniref:Poly [ADP-ribose] polymerase n=1 Tax=Dreissena polymorpha TaxID=45954 RepID=A0A9D4JM14_DREPO|nr:protein mono-ADP-ribosyltransferase PARP11-like [Dreissena polymorpha]KAH3815314.1 hypothetical protein DPMN_143836 [Dreissena polymorpha]
MAQADKGIHVLKSAILDGTNAIRSTVVAGVREVKVKTDQVVSAIKEQFEATVDSVKREFRDSRTNDDDDNYWQRSGIEQDGVWCDVCNVSLILGTRWKCRECPNYDMCSSCFNDPKRMHDMSHSFKKIKTPGSISTKGQKNEHEVQRLPSLLPCHLTKITRDEHVTTVYLETFSEEFTNVKRKFIHTLDKEIVSIRSVQNNYLWEVYFLKLGQMEKMNGKFGANEKILFHGTKPEIIYTACAHNLDTRLAGTNVGAILGEGTYFASTAKISDSYATPAPTTGHSYMLQCRVLVGEWTKGKPGLRRPPEVAQTSDGQVRLYDSCVDRVRNPSIFCIFDQNQYYPEYIIEYK